MTQLEPNKALKPDDHGPTTIEVVVRKRRVPDGALLLQDISSIAAALHESIARLVQVQMGYSARTRLRQEAKRLVRVVATDIRQGSGILVLEPLQLERRLALGESPAVVATENLVHGINRYQKFGTWPEYFPVQARNSLAGALSLDAHDSLEIRVVNGSVSRCQITESTSQALREPETFDLQKPVQVVGRITALDESAHNFRVDTSVRKIKAFIPESWFDQADSLRWKRVVVEGLPQDPLCKKLTVTTAPRQALSEEFDGLFLPTERSTAAHSQAFRATQEYLERIEKLSEKWDSYAAKKPSQPNIDFARTFTLGAISMLSNYGMELPVPFIAPTPKGGIQFEFRSSERELELEIEQLDHFSYLKVAPDFEEEGKIDGRWAANRLLFWLLKGD